MSPAFRVARARLALIAVFFFVVWWLAYAWPEEPIIRIAAMRSLFSGLPALFLSSFLSVRRAYLGLPFNSATEISLPTFVFIALYLISGRFS